MPNQAAIDLLDKHIRTWLDRDDIATWEAMAAEAGVTLQPGFPINQVDEE